MVGGQRGKVEYHGRNAPHLAGERAATEGSWGGRRCLLLGALLGALCSLGALRVRVVAVVAVLVVVLVPLALVLVVLLPLLCILT